MYVKVINPKTDGRKAYANRGSARRTVNYLCKEAKETWSEATFFTSLESERYSGQEVVEKIDANWNGLGRESAKFYSLVLSPDTEEIALQGNIPEIFMNYTRDAMRLYAQNFTLEDNRNLSEHDLVWAATIHKERKHRGDDKDSPGEPKPGLHMHVHIIVSARDASQQVTLNPLGAINHFNRVEFQAQAVIQMDDHVGHMRRSIQRGPVLTREERVAEMVATITEKAAAAKEKQRSSTTGAQQAAKEARLEERIERVNAKLIPSQQLKATQVQDIAYQRGYDLIFYARLKSIERNAERGVYTPEPHKYLSTGRVAKVGQLVTTPMDSPNVLNANPLARPERPIKQPVALAALQRSISGIAQAMSLKAVTQEVRSEQEKAQDYEHRM